MMIFLVIAIIVTIKNKLTNKGLKPKLSIPRGAQDLESCETNDIENIINVNDRKQMMGIDSPEEQALLSDPKNNSIPPKRRIDFSLFSGSMRDQISGSANENINGI
jgi:hypothetical protein